MSEEKADYLTDALEMIGMNEPAIEIERSRTVVTRRNGKLTEEVRPAFVKISTAFKGEMKNLDPIALKVWLYIALSVNRNSGKANPGLRTIAEDCDLAINTVRAALERLEEAQLLTVDRQSRKYNIYEPVDYVSANRAEPTVSSTDTDAQTVSISGETVSISGETVSPRMILNQRNQRNQNQPSEEKIIEKANKTVDAILDNERQSAGKTWSKLPAPYTDYAKAFCESTGLNYHKKYFSDWASTFDEWMTDGFQPADVVSAVESIRAMKAPTPIHRPGSITWKMRSSRATYSPSVEQEIIW